MKTIFISHAWNDLSTAKLFEFIAELESSYSLWIDTEQIKPGDIIRHKISEGLQKADLVLLLLSKDCLRRADILFEIETAIGLNKTIIPCLLDETAIESLNEIRDTLFNKEAILFIDFYKEALGLQSGFLFLRQYLLEFELKSYGDTEEEATLKEKNERLSKLLARMAFIRQRQFSGTSGNSSTNQSILMMATQMRQMFETDLKNPLAYQYVLLSEAIENLVAIYTDPNDNQKRTVELYNSINRIDPDKVNPIFQQFSMALAPRI
jgi:TIR domain